jgi:hypothetical protein
MLMAIDRSTHIHKLTYASFIRTDPTDRASPSHALFTNDPKHLPATHDR